MVEKQECSHCQMPYPLEDYTNGATGFRTVCKQCTYGKLRKKWSSSYQEYLKVLHNTSRSKRKQTMEWHISPDYLNTLWEEQEGRCKLSGVQMTHHRDGSGAKEFNASIDRIDTEQGYLPGNVQLVCYRINILRHTLSTDMFYWWIHTIHKHSCD